MDAVESLATTIALGGMAVLSYAADLSPVAAICGAGAIGMGANFAAHTWRYAKHADGTKATFVRPANSPGGKLGFYVGRTEGGRIKTADLATLPHLRICGSTGSGKSTFLNCLIDGWLHWYTPEQVCLCLVDLKRVELGDYAESAHVAHVAKEPADAASLIAFVNHEMDGRFAELERIKQRMCPDDWGRIVIVIDEIAELAPKEYKDAVKLLERIARLGRAAGIHIVAATQRLEARTSGITPVLKANMPGCICFHAASEADSLLALDVKDAAHIPAKPKGHAIWKDGSEITHIRGPILAGAK